MNPRTKKVLVALYAVYLSFIVLSISVDVALKQNEFYTEDFIDQRHFMFKEDGEQGYYTVYRENTSALAFLDVGYDRTINRIWVNCENIRHLEVNAWEIAQEDPDNAREFFDGDQSGISGYYKKYFMGVQRLEANISCDTDMELIFNDVIDPVSVTVNNQRYDRGDEEGSGDYYFDDEDYTISTTVPEGYSQVVVEFVQNIDDADPVAIIDASDVYVTLGETVELNASASVSGNGEIIDYLWDFGDQTFDSGVAVEHTYDEANEYVVILTVRAIHDTTGKTMLNSVMETINVFNETKDTDGDGMPDYWELQYGDILDPDFDDADLDHDKDGLTAYSEYRAGTDPNDSDTDGDGMPDGWELDNVLDPRDATDGPKDYDGDGYSNLEEYESGTDPMDDGSHPKEGTLGTMEISMIVLFVVILVVVLILVIRKRKVKEEDSVPAEVVEEEEEEEIVESAPPPPPKFKCSSCGKELDDPKAELCPSCMLLDELMDKPPETTSLKKSMETEKKRETGLDLSGADAEKKLKANMAKGIIYQCPSCNVQLTDVTNRCPRCTKVLDFNKIPGKLPCPNCSNLTEIRQTECPMCGESMPQVLEVDEESTCPHCGIPISKDASVCPICGEMIQTQLPEGMMRCPDCGSLAPKDAVECPGCHQAFIIEEFGEETERCPFCSGEVQPNVPDCPHCGKTILLGPGEGLFVCPDCGVQMDHYRTDCIRCGSELRILDDFD